VKVKKKKIGSVC